MKRRGKQKYFEQLVRNTERKVCSFIAALGVSSHEVDDIAQDTYLAFYQNMDKKPDDVEELQWLVGIARNKAMGYFRKLKSQNNRHMLFIQESLLTAEMDTVLDGETEKAERLKGCLGKLPKAKQQLILLRYTKEWTSDEIARQEGGTPQSVRKSLSRIRLALKRCVERFS